MWGNELRHNSDDLLMDLTRSDSAGMLKQQLKVNFCDYHLPMFILKQELDLVTFSLRNSLLNNLIAVD